MHKEPKEYFMNKLDESIREVEEQLEELETRMEDAGWEPELDYERQIEGLRFRLEEFKKAVDRFELKDDTTLSKFRKSCEDTLSEIFKETQELTARVDQILLE
jgi:uncharacterized protein YaaN involved in tellurite resistance